MSSSKLKLKYEFGYRIENENVYIFLYSNEEDYFESIDYLKKIKNKLILELNKLNLNTPKNVDYNVIKFKNENENINKLRELLLKKLYIFNVEE